MKNFICLILLISFIPSFGIWREVNTPTSEHLNKIEIINGVAFCVGNNGTLLKSTDEGENWTAVTNLSTGNIGNIGNITSILFITSNIGFFTTSEGKVFKTTNGGSSWISKTLQSGGINGISFKDNSTGIAAGDNGNFFKTTDGGANWTNLGSQSVFVVNDLTFVNDTLAVAVGPLGSLLYSTDAGSSWTYQGVSTTETFSAIEKKNDATAVIVGTNGTYLDFSATSLTTNSIKTIDSNKDWLKDVHVTIKENDFERVIAVGFSSSILINNNSFKTWDLDSVNNLNGIHFFNDTIGVACGFDGKIYKTVTGGVPTSSNEIKREQISLYPNPANNLIYFQNYELDNRYEIYNMNGSLVLNGILQNSYLDVSMLSSGNYLIRLVGDRKFSTGRFLKK